MWGTYNLQLHLHTSKSMNVQAKYTIIQINFSSFYLLKKIISDGLAKENKH